MKWRAVIAVPVVYEIEYASDIHTAMAGVTRTIKGITPVAVCSERNYSAKLLTLVGPEDKIEPWATEAHKRRDERLAAEAAKKEEPSGDGPSAA